MALTEYGVNDPEAVKLWSRKLMRESLKNTWASKFMGKDSNSLVQVLDDTSKGPGDRVRCLLRMQLTGDGVAGDATLEGNEEALATYHDDVYIDQLRHAVRSKGKMTEQRIPFSIREEARLGLQDWWSARFDYWFMNQLAGNTSQTDDRYTGMQSAIAADSAHVIYPSGVTAVADMTATSTQQFSLSMVDQCVLKANTLTPKIRPVNTGDAQSDYVMFVTPEHHYDMRRNSSTLEWADIQKAAMQGGAISKNKIFTGAIGMYNKTILHESYYLPITTTDGGSKVGTAVFCGSQAGIMAFGRDNSKNRMSWKEKYFDYDNQLGVKAGLIGGLKKTTYNSKDFATITVYAAHSAEAVSNTGRT